VNDNKNVDVSF